MRDKLGRVKTLGKATRKGWSRDSKYNSGENLYTMLTFFISRSALCYPTPILFSLQDRVQKWKEEEKERVANLPDPTVPAGHVLMDKKEKDETLQVLLRSKL